MQGMRRFAIAVLLVLGLVSTAGLSTACRRGDGDGGEPLGPTPEPTGSVEPTGTDGTPADTTAVRLYLVRGEVLGVASRDVPATPQIAHAAVQALLEGPTAEDAGFGLATEIPEGTELLGVVIDGGTATVDLSDEFDDGGGSLSMQMRAAQIVFTLTQFPSVERVDFEIEGEPIEALGGEGVDVAFVERLDFTNVLPLILVESPTPGQSVTSPVRITGMSNTFEASFVVNITDPEGLIITEQAGMATSGTGTWGTFDVSVEFETERSGLGAVIVFESSAKDGSPINVVEIPVRMGE